ncbi:MAG: SGNH/GDSL hydrolase family protein [PVC group bacterium]
MKTILIAIALFLAGALPLSSLPAQEDAWLVWADRGTEGNPIFLSRRRAEGWSTERYPDEGGERTNYMPSLGIDGEGNPWLVWAAQNGEETARIQYSRKDAAGWSAPRPVTGSPTGWESAPAIVFDRDGRPWIAWAAVSGASSEIFCARGADDGFSNPVMVSAPDSSPDARPALSLSEDGDPVVTWEGWTGEQYGYFASRFREAGWSPEEPAARAGGFAISAAAFSGAPLPFENLAQRGAWAIRRDQQGHWEAARCRAALPADPGGRTAGVSPPAGADRIHQYTGFGDSITYGSPDKNKCYIPLLKNTLESSYPGNTYTINNKGYPGARTYELLSGGGYPHRCPGIDAVLDAYPATMILIMGGTNDIEDGDNYSDISWNLGEMATRARARNYEPILATIIPRWDSPVFLRRSQTLSTSYIRPLAAEKNVRLADPWQVYIDYGDYGSLYEGDHVHPEWSEGDQKIADAWFAAIPAPAAGKGGLDEIIEWSERWASGL